MLTLLLLQNGPRLRPASYLDEPRYETRDDDNFTDTGSKGLPRVFHSTISISLIDDVI
jgi:hypothetical protein